MPALRTSMRSGHEQIPRGRLPYEMARAIRMLRTPDGRRGERGGTTRRYWESREGFGWHANMRKCSPFPAMRVAGPLWRERISLKKRGKAGDMKSSLDEIVSHRARARALGCCAYMWANITKCCCESRALAPPSFEGGDCGEPPRGGALLTRY